LQLTGAIADDPQGRKADDQPTPGLRVVAIEHLLWVPADDPAQPDELLGAPLRRGFKNGAFARRGGSLPLGHRAPAMLSEATSRYLTFGHRPIGT